MRPLQLDFIRAPGLAPAQAAAVAACGALLLLAVLGWLLQLQADVRALRDARPQSRLQLPAPSAAADGDTRQAIAQAQQVQAALGLPWGALFRQIETVRVNGVTLLAVQRDAGQARRLRLSGQARRLEDALAYVSQLAATAGFANAHLVAHEAAASEPGGGAGVRFALLVDWVAAP